MTLASIPLNKKKHDRLSFDCGIDELNNFLRVTAAQQSTKDNSRTFVLTDKENTESIIGFYALTMTPIDISALPLKLQKKHRNAQSAGLIARLAVDSKFTKNGYGEWLLVDALDKLLTASESVGFPLVVVDAKSGAKEFYQKFGFTEFLHKPDKLFITIADVRANLQNQ